jgi:NitT/TauT family transport system substrate-binding protein
MISYKKIIFIYVFCCCQVSFAAEKPLLRLGVLAFGTVNWELAAMQRAQLMETEHYRLQVVTKLANPQASKIALQSGAVDMIVADWIWVSQQRALGRDYTFFPYSNTTGALVVAQDSAVKTLQDLRNKKMAVAGGELDKNSLLLHALMLKQGQADVFASIAKKYGAPPLLAQEMRHKRVDALLTYWHYAARMEADGFKVLLTGNDILQGLGMQAQVPSIGYVFSEQWAEQNLQAIRHFFASTRQAKNDLCINDAVWKSIGHLTRAKTQQESRLLRSRYCEGRILRWGNEEKQAAAEIYQQLKKVSHNRLTRHAEKLEKGVFWEQGL